MLSPSLERLAAADPRYRALFAKRGVTVAATPRAKPGTALAEMVAWIRSVPSGTCSACKNWADKMDAIGPEECLKQADQIAADMLTRRGMLEESLRESSGWRAWAGVIAGHLPDAVLLAGAKWLIVKAVNRSRELVASQLAQSIH